jgi:hypothetical protein
MGVNTQQKALYDISFKNKRKAKGGSNRDRRHSKVGYAEIEMLRVVLHLVASRSRKK